MLITFPLDANVLNPGDSNQPPDVFSTSGTPPLLGDITGSFNFGSGALTGTWEDVVLVDPFGVTCTGCLDFAFEVNVDPTVGGAAVFSTSLSRFFGYSTDVGYVSGSGGIAPNSVSRGPAGGGITFNFNTNSSAIIPGASSEILVVATNATTFDSNGIAGISGGNSDRAFSGQVTNLFEPTFVAPEPGTMLLLGLGLAGIAALRKRTN